MTITPNSLSEKIMKYKTPFLIKEDAEVFKLTSITVPLKKQLKKKYPNESTEKINERIYAYLKVHSLNNQTFEYLGIKANLGGTFWYVICPKCKGKYKNLYLPSKHIVEREQRYLCSNCHKLKARSTVIGRSKKYVEVIKPLKRLEKLRSMLISSRMTPEKSKPLLEEYQRLERELIDSPSYRLYKFQVEHKIISPEV